LKKKNQIRYFQKLAKNAIAFASSPSPQLDDGDNKVPAKTSRPLFQKEVTEVLKFFQR